jgi:hypothetical protein
MFISTTSFYGPSRFHHGLTIICLCIHALRPSSFCAPSMTQQNTSTSTSRRTELIPAEVASTQLDSTRLNLTRPNLDCQCDAMWCVALCCVGCVVLYCVLLYYILLYCIVLYWVMLCYWFYLHYSKVLTYCVVAGYGVPSRAVLVRVYRNT